MSERTIPTSAVPEIIIDQILGNLQVKGWDQPEVSVSANPQDLSLEEKDDTLHISCRSDCLIRMPAGGTLRAGNINGDARFKYLEDTLAIETVHGSLVMKNVAETQIGAVYGELLAKYVAGGLSVAQVMGNANVRAVQGDCLLGEVSGNLELRNVEGNVKASTQGNARIRLDALFGNDYQIEADGVIQCRIPTDASLSAKISSEAELIRVRLPNQSKVFQTRTHELTLGSGEINLVLSADGEVYLTAEEATDFGAEEREFGYGEDFGGLSPEMTEKISRQVESQILSQMDAMTRQLNEQMAQLEATFRRTGLTEAETEEILQRTRASGERATIRSQEQMRRAQERLERRLEAERRRNEAKAQAAERRNQDTSRKSWDFSWNPPPPQPKKEPVSEEERLMILKMLEQKKISLDEAEKLLSALEGNES
jgi:hypothetical protein